MQKTVSRVLVVIDDQDTQRRRLIGNEGRGVAARLATQAFTDRQAHHELAAPGEPVADRLHTAAVQLDDTPHQRQAYAQATERTAGVRVDLHEQVEHPVDGIAFDAAAIVANAYRDTVVGCFGAQPDVAASGVYFAALLRMLMNTCARRIGSPTQAIGMSAMATCRR